MLQVKNLKVRVEDREILKGINLTVNKGEVHAIMGPNGSGKSTFARALSGHPGYEVTEGEVLYNGQDLLDMDPDERARDGVFMAFQYPVEIPGVNNAYFLKAALNAKRKHDGPRRARRDGLHEAGEGKAQAPARRRFAAAAVGERRVSPAARRSATRFSTWRCSSRRSRCWMKPTRASTSTRCSVVSEGVNAMRSPDRAFIVVTHYQRLLNYIVPDFVHVLSDGRIVRSGGRELALELEEKGYAGQTAAGARQ